MESPLYFISNNIKLIKLFYKNRNEIFHDTSALEDFAIFVRSNQVLNYLVVEKGEKHIVEEYGDIILYNACSTGNIKNVKLLLEFYNKPLKNSLLNVAVENSYYSIVEILLKQGLRELNYNHITCNKILKLLMKYDLDFNTVDINGNSFLHKLASRNLNVYNDLNLIKTLLENKDINVSIMNKNGKTPLNLIFENIKPFNKHICHAMIEEILNHTSCNLLRGKRNKHELFRKHIEKIDLEKSLDLDQDLNTFIKHFLFEDLM